MIVIILLIVFTELTYSPRIEVVDGKHYYLFYNTPFGRDYFKLF